MEQLVRVQRCNQDGTAQVMHVRQSACSGDCHKCSGCGAVEQKMLFTAHNPIGARPGQVVTVRTETGPVLAAAAVLYLLPVALFVVGYISFLLLWELGGLGGILGFVLGVAVSVVYDRKVASKQKTEYTITGLGHVTQPSEKGDNDLD